MKLSIIIPSHNRCRLLKKCLVSIFASSFKNFEVIVVDDNSTDNTKSLKEKYDITYIKNSANKGAAYSRNVGAKQANGEILVFIDSDVVIKKNTLKNLVDIFKDSKESIACGYKLPKNLSKSWSSDFVMLRKTFSYCSWLKSKRQVIENSFPETALFAIKKQVFNEHWGFNPLFSKGSEDHEFGRRLSRNYKIKFHKSLGVYHHYEDFFGYLKKLFPRTKAFIQLVLKDKKFERRSFGTGSEAKNAILVLVLCFALFFGVLNAWFLIFSAIILMSFIYIRRSFYVHILKNKPSVLLLSPFMDLLVYLVQGLSSVYGVVVHTLKPVARVLGFSVNVIRIFASRTPPNIGLFATAHCNLGQCKHCFYWREIDTAHERKQLSLKELRKISKNLDTVYFLTITGGEPSLRDDLAQICEAFYKNNNMRVISFHTNGFAPYKIRELTERILEKCPKAVLDVAVSLDGPREIHNKIRGDKRSFDNAIKTLELLLPMREIFPNLEFQYSTTLSTYSKEKLIEMEKELDKFRCWHTWTYARGNVRDNSSRPSHVKFYEKFREEFRKRKNSDKKVHFFKSPIMNLIRWSAGIMQMDINIKTLNEKRQVVPCNSGKKTVVLRDNGDVEPCEMLMNFVGKKESFMGNIRDYNYDLRRLLKSKKAKKTVSLIKAGKCYCTHEGNLYTSMFFYPKIYPRLIYNSLRYMFMIIFRR